MEGESIIPYGDVLWALREDVQVTLLTHDPDGLRTTYLVTRTYNLGVPHYRRRLPPYIMPWDHALVLDFDDSGSVRINGCLVTTSDLMEWAMLVDAVSLSPHFPELGDCVTTRVRG